jgi:hypothetical protein
MKPTANQLSVCAARVLAVTPRSPRTQVDTVTAEIAILIGDLCETADDAQRLTQHLVDKPQPRWNFAALKNQAARFMAPAPSESKPEPLQVYGFEYPEWAWQPTTDGRANHMREVYDAIETELWRRVLTWTPEYREKVEAEIRAMMADYQRRHPSGPFQDPTAAQIKAYLIVAAGHENERERRERRTLEPCPIPEPDS